METQDDSIDIAHLQRVALGLESAHSQPFTGAPGSAESPLLDNTPQNPPEQQFSGGCVSSTAQEVSPNIPSNPPVSPPRSPSQEQHATGLVGPDPSSTEQENPNPTPALRLSGKMSSAETVPSDTQVISQSVYDDLIRQNRETATSCFDSNLGNQATLATLHEGDSGHVDLLAAFDNANPDAVNLDDNENEDPSSQKLGESSPLHYQPNLFPESQRFVSKTPMTAVKHSAERITMATPPTASRNPLGADIESSGGILALSQVFRATQAPSSPLVHGQNPDPLSDRPSPNLPIQGRPFLKTMSSPLNNIAATFPQDSSEPNLNYISMKESQAQRDKILQERMSRSAENIYSEDQSDGEFEKEPSFVERIKRQRLINEEAAAQFAGLSASARPGSLRSRPSSVAGSSQAKRTERRDWADGPAVITEDAQHAPVVLQHGGTSEEETEQEEEPLRPISRSQELNVSTEEDKENCNEESATPIAAAADAHGRLSQALAFEESISRSRGGSVELPSQAQPPHQGEEGELESSQILVVKDSQLSPGRKENEQSDNHQEPWNARQAHQHALGNDASASLLKATPSPTKSLRIQSTPPSTSHRSRVSFRLHDEDRVTRPRSGSNSSHGSLNGLPKSHEAQGGEAFSSYPAGREPVEFGSRASKFDGPEKTSSMPSRVAETPVRHHVQSTGDEAPGTSIPETSPNRFQNQDWANETNDETNDEEMDQEDDDDLPPVYVSQHDRGHQSQPVMSDSSSPAKRIYNSKILSSPSGRQRRALTEIAADASPQVGLGPFEVDFNILSADDREFRSAIAMSPIQARKRRRGNDGQIAFASDPVLPATPHSTSHFPPPREENEPKTVAEPQKEKAPARARSLFEKRSRPSKRPDSVWDVEDSPHFHLSRKERLGLLTRPRREAKPAQPTIAETNPVPQPAEPVAQAVAENSRDMDTEPEDPPSSAVPEQPSMENIEPTPIRVTPAPADRVEIAVNQVFAPWTGVKRAYYPATCFGTPFGTQQSRYLVKFEDSAPVEVSTGAVKRLELRVGDGVKVDLPGFPKVTHIIRGFDDKLSADDIAQGASIGLTPMTDVYGYSTLILGPKQPKSLPSGNLAGPESVVKVPISRIYLDNNLWNRLKDRTFTFNASTSQSESRLQTPSDRHTTPASPSTRLSRSIRYATGLFAGMVFAVSYGENDGAKLRTTQMILENDGRILHDGFNELFDLPMNAPLSTPTKSPALGANGFNGQFRLTSGAEDIGFACLIADKHSRRPKYMQALALNLPCLSDRWIEDCVAQGRIVDWEMYLLPAGESSYLYGATKSRILTPYPAIRARLLETIAARPNLLQGQSVLIVMGRSKADEERRRAYLFLTYALGAARVERVSDIKSVRSILDSQPTPDATSGWDWIYVDTEEKASAIASILGPGSQKAQPTQKSRKRKRGNVSESIRGSDLGLTSNFRIVGNEFVCQSLILGKLVDQ